MQTAVWSIIASIFIGILVLIVNKLWEPIAEYIGSPFDVGGRVEDLEDAVEKVRFIHEDLHRLDPYPSSKQCKGWMCRVRDLYGKAETIRTRIGVGHNLNYLSKCDIGKQADKELRNSSDLIATGTELVKQAKATPSAFRMGGSTVQNQDMFVRDCDVVLPQNDQLRGMDSYQQKVLSFVLDNNSTHQSGLLGIWGMGGVGKTSLLEFVRDSPAVHRTFDHVLFFKADRAASVVNTQKAIVARMGLPRMPDEISQGDIIYNYLQDKSFLLLIGDLWGYHKLRDVGIPMVHGGVPHGSGLLPQYRRKVVFTTRSKDVCGKMGCANNTIRLECLSEGDAWELFVHKVGKEIINDDQIHKLARQIVHECSGLPLALCTIGQAMSTKKDPREWRCVVDLLKNSKLLEITNIDIDLFDRLKSSYNNMPDRLKKCFLICSLWAEDKNIPKGKLIEWWIGLGFIYASNNNPTDEGYSIINWFMNASMLEKGDIGFNSTETSHVKMHKIIRMMALWIVKDHGYVWLPDSFHRLALSEEKWCEVERVWVSSVHKSKWSPPICIPHLIMLVSRLPFSLRIIPSFKEITFLDLEGTNRDIFPVEICALGKLQYLNLSASKFAALPLELTRLSSLKYLHIRGIGALQTIPEGLISQLEKLQQLDLFCSGSIYNRVEFLPFLLEELSSETIDLFYFGITVHTDADISKLGKLSSVCTQALCMDQFKDKNRPNKIDLRLLASLVKVRELSITNSSVIQELVAEGHHYFDSDGLLSYLDFLELRNLSKLQKVTWKNAGLNIRVVDIYSCIKLTHVTWVRNLKSLEELSISYCSEIEQVIIDNAEADQTVVGFCQLRKLKLEQLPELFNISEQGLPKELSYVHVANCEKLKVIKVQERNNQHKIRIDCSQDWWTRLNEGIVNPLFVPEF